MYQKLNELRGKSGTGMDLLRDSQGNLILESGERRKRWKEHFETLLNVGSQQTKNEVLVNQIVQETNDEPMPSEADVEGAIKKLKNGKAAGCDGIKVQQKDEKIANSP